MRGLWPTLRKRKGRLTGYVRQEPIGEGSAGRRETYLSKVDDEINRTATSKAGFVIEPSATCDNDVVILAPRTQRRAFGPNLEAVVFQHITERNATDLVGKLRDFHL